MKINWMYVGFGMIGVAFLTALVVFAVQAYRWQTDYFSPDKESDSLVECVNQAENITLVHYVEMGAEPERRLTLVVAVSFPEEEGKSEQHALMFSCALERDWEVLGILRIDIAQVRAVDDGEPHFIAIARESIYMERDIAEGLVTGDAFANINKLIADEDIDYYELEPEFFVNVENPAGDMMLAVERLSR